MLTNCSPTVHRLLRQCSPTLFPFIGPSLPLPLLGLQDPGEGQSHPCPPERWDVVASRTNCVGLAQGASPASITCCLAPLPPTSMLLRMRRIGLGMRALGTAFEASVKALLCMAGSP